MSSGTADALGLSRAILCNGEIIMIYLLFTKVHINSAHVDSFHFTDGLVKRLEELEKTAELYKGKRKSTCQSCLQ